jgi:PelA/Pel-15E family pectate lyase
VVGPSASNTTQADSEKAIRIAENVLLHQSNNGGWPQTYLLDLSGYSKYITFNDDAMIGVMTVLCDVAERDEAYAFVDEERRQQAAVAVQKGIVCILQCQIVVDGKLTAWCAQHDHCILEPHRRLPQHTICDRMCLGITR